MSAAISCLAISASIRRGVKMKKRKCQKKTRRKIEYLTFGCIEAGTFYYLAEAIREGHPKAWIFLGLLVLRPLFIYFEEKFLR
jgi:hypothetical protein